MHINKFLNSGIFSFKNILIGFVIFIIFGVIFFTIKTPVDFNCTNFQVECEKVDAKHDDGKLHQCEDEIDNDGDGLIDLADPGCDNDNDNKETDPKLKQCSDGIDNDGDGLIDLADPGCGNANDNEEIDPAAEVSESAGGKGVGVNTGPQNCPRYAPDSNLILCNQETIDALFLSQFVAEHPSESETHQGPHTANVYPDSSPYFKKYLSLGDIDDDSHSVSLLQAYLKLHGFNTMPVDGIFGTLTFNALVSWQELYSKQILAPWGITKGTGYFGPTSRLNANHELGFHDTVIVKDIETTCCKPDSPAHLENEE